MPLGNLINVFFQEQRWKFIFALIIGLSDTCVNVLLLLSLGKGMSLAFMEDSAKAGLFDLVIGGVHSSSAFFSIFVALVLAKGALVFLDHFLQDSLGDAFVLYIRKMLVNGTAVLEDYDKSFSKLMAEYTPLKNVVTKGLIEAIGDILFVVFLVVVFTIIAPKVSVAFLILSVVYLCFTFLWSERVEKRRKARNEKRSKWQKNMQLAADEARVLRAFNREGSLKRKWIKGLDQFFDSQVNYFQSKAIGEGVFPVFFFSMLGVFIFLMDVKSENAAHFYSLLLLLLYAQSPMRRLSRLPVIWKAGITAAQQLPDRFFDEEEKQASGRGSELTIHTVKGKHMGVSIKPGELLLVRTHDNAEVKDAFINGLLGFSNADVLFSMDGENAQELSGFYIRRSIVVASPALPVFGNTVEEAISFSRSEKNQERVVQVLEKVNQLAAYPMKPDQVIDYTDRKMLLWLQLARIEYTRKPFVVLDIDFSSLERKDVLRVFDFIHFLKRKRGVLFLTTTITEGMLIDQQIEL
ncbi:MAG: hypothetical protein RLZZ77_314 [Bacteroidota bacterium]